MTPKRVENTTDSFVLEKAPFLTISSKTFLFTAVKKVLNSEEKFLVLKGL